MTNNEDKKVNIDISVKEEVSSKDKAWGGFLDVLNAISEKIKNVIGGKKNEHSLDEVHKNAEKEMEEKQKKIKKQEKIKKIARQKTKEKKKAKDVKKKIKKVNVIPVKKEKDIDSGKGDTSGGGSKVVEKSRKIKLFGLDNGDLVVEKNVKEFGKSGTGVKDRGSVNKGDVLKNAASVVRGAMTAVDKHAVGRDGGDKSRALDKSRAR